MLYQPGDCVYPADLPRRFLCRIMEAEKVSIGSGTFQILALRPLEGPWRPGTVLVREDASVLPARAPCVRRRLPGRRTGHSLGESAAPESAA